MTRARKPWSRNKEKTRTSFSANSGILAEGMDDEGESTQHRLYRISPAALKDSAGPTDYFPEECIVRVCSLFVIAICWLGTAFSQTNAGLPAFFERNMGQAGQQVSYFSRAAGYVLYIEADGASFVT